ncbi:MAG: Bug family tripartite tricarboxylate transporter substrate binding protein [Ferrovibrio sp.]
MLSRLQSAFCATLAVLAVSQSAAASEWPLSGTTTIVVPYPAGNIADIAARTIGQKLNERTGKTIIVDNRAGASTQIGTSLVARAPADGRTLLLTGAIFATNPALFPKLPYDSEKDLAPVGLVVSNPLVLTTAKSKPFTDFKSMADYAKAKPGHLALASGGSGTLTHIALALMGISLNTEINHVPYKGGSAAATDTLSGQVDGFWDNPSSAIPQIKADRIRPLAVSGRTRNPALPDVPTMIELGYADFEAINWFGVFAPGKTDPQLLDVIHKEIQAVLALPDVQERFAREGVTAGGPPRAQYATFVTSEIKKWGTLIREKNIQAE